MPRLELLNGLYCDLIRQISRFARQATHDPRRLHLACELSRIVYDDLTACLNSRTELDQLVPPEARRYAPE